MKFILILLGIILSGCASHVTFYERASDNQNFAKSSVIYLDQYGDLYSSSDLIAKNAAERPVRLACANFDALCEVGDNLKGEELKAWNTTYKDWRGQQDARWDAAAKAVYQKLSDTTRTRPIIYLIHGFRVGDATSDYDLARRRINELGGFSDPPHLVFINWDGRTSGKAGIPKAWLEAQWSGPQVGFRLRRLINKVHALRTRNKPAAAPTYILSHSSGAFVAGAIVGDPGAALPCLHEENGESGKCGPTYAAFYENRARQIDYSVKDEVNWEAVPNIPGLRLGMLAAATSTTTFTGSSRDKQSGAGTILGKNSAIIVAYNPEDSAITKGVLPTRLGGESGLGSEREDICELAAHYSAAEQPVLIPVDMRRSGPYVPSKSSHSFSVYLRQAEFKDFADQLFGHLHENRITQNKCLEILKEK